MSTRLAAPTWASTLETFSRTLGDARARELLETVAAELGIEQPHTSDVPTLARIAASLIQRDDVASLLGLGLEIRCRTYLAVGTRAAAPESSPEPERRYETDRLAVIKKLDLARDDARALLDEVARRAAAALELPIGLVSVVLDDAQWFAGKTGIGDWLEATSGTPIEWSFCAHVVRDRIALVVEDATLDPRFAANPLVGMDGVRAYAGVPLTTSDGVVLGSLCAIGSERRSITPAQLHALQSLATEAMNALESRFAR